MSDAAYLVVDRKNRVVDGYACILPAMDSMRSWGKGARVIRADGTVLAVMVSAGGGKTRERAERTRVETDEAVELSDDERAQFAPARLLH